MRNRPTVVLLLSLATLAAGSAAATEIKGAAILDHPCGKIAVKHMGLIHAGKFDEATKLATAEFQAAWNAQPAEDREMMSGMMQEMSQTEEEFAAEIKSNGVLTVDGSKATLQVIKKVKDESGESTETTTQRYVLDGSACAITR